MKHRPVRVCLVGCGAIAEQAYLPSLSGLEECALVGLVDLDTARARMLADRYGIEHVFSDPSRIPDVAEAAIIALPNFLHQPVSCELMNRGVHILCEKPMSITCGEAETMVQCCAGNGVRLHIGQIRRMYWSSRKVKDILDREELGRVVSFRMEEGIPFDWPTVSGFFFDRSKAGGGVLIDPGVHVLDLLLWWLGDNPEAVAYRDDDFGGGIEAECCLDLAYGSTAGTVKLSRLSRLRNTYEIRCEKGAITYSPYLFDSITVQSRGKRRELSADTKTDFIGYFRHMLRDFCGAVRRDSPSILNAETVAPVMRLIERCYGKATRLDLPWLRPQSV
ncbi:MAG: Gfo/Idh/MocA family oxidoreductase [Desulfobacteraceae bacterium]|nr:Gfo/Idh/MocA family oxidoreductase [Desulfobacteraceae bacterium]